MSDRQAPIVTPEHVKRAYAQLRRPDWPPLDEMARLAKQYAIVSARASSLAHGQTIPPEPVAAPVAAATALPSAYGARALGHTERRRRADMDAIDLKSRAAGERDDQE